MQQLLGEEQCWSLIERSVWQNREGNTYTIKRESGDTMCFSPAASNKVCYAVSDSASKFRKGVEFDADGLGFVQRIGRYWDDHVAIVQWKLANG